MTYPVGHYSADGGLCRRSETRPISRRISAYWAPNKTMAAPGCGIIFAPSQRMDRSTSLRRSTSLNSKPKHITGTRPPFNTIEEQYETSLTHNHSRSLSDKMRSLHRKKNSNESNVSSRCPPSSAAPAAKKGPKHLDLMEAVSQQDLARQYSEGQREIGMGKENAVQDTMKLSRPALSMMEQNSRKMAYDQYLSEAFGLEGQMRPKPAAVQRLRGDQGPELRPESDMSVRTTDSMEVLFHINPTDLPAASAPAPAPPAAPAPSTLSAKDRRPKIQVTIPGSTSSVKRPRSNAHLVQQMNRQKTRGKVQEPRQQDLLTMVSPPSSTAGHMYEPEARLSVVSPLSAVQMPKPRRPFSAFSLEEMTNDMPIMPHSAPPLEKSNSSDSSDDTGEHDDGSSNYSGRSSMSSLTEDHSMEKPGDRANSIAFSICSPAAAGVFDGVPLTPRAPQALRSFKSTTSLGIDMNKPLPPAPGMEEVAPLNVSGQGRPGSMRSRRALSPLSFSCNSMMDLSPQLPSRMSSLRSKYTPADLDALDAAFTRTSPNTQAAFYNHIEPSLSQAQMELEAHLGTIKEDTMYHPNIAPAVHDPLQISRGPNTMVPSRQAPPPPSSLKLSRGSMSGRKKKLHKKPAVHVALQMRADNPRGSSESERGDSGTGSDRPKRPSATSAPMRAASMVKANKILGKGGAINANINAMQMEREISAESHRSASPHTTYDDSSSPTMSRGDSSTPETDVSSIPDHAFEEVRARLELLSPKNDSHHFSALGPQHGIPRSSPAVELPSPEQSNHVYSEGKSGLNESNNEGVLAPRKDSLAPEILVTPINGKNESLVEVRSIFSDVGDESHIHPLRRRGTRPEELRPRSLASIAMSEIPDMYASLPSPGLSINTMMEDLTAEEVERLISADTAERVLLRILQNLDNLEDLFATATVSRGFYRTFKRHELPLMKNALYGMSPAAWELREISPPYPSLEASSPTLDYTPSLYLQHYMRDMYTMIALKSMILIHCESFLRADTITALAGGETKRAAQIDDAFWRVWTFCQTFGCGSNREEDIVGQMDWLRGGAMAAKQRRSSNRAKLGEDVDSNSVLYSSPTSFGRGNVGGLSAEDLYDMTEIWTCLGVLVRGFQGKRQEAREVGIFQNADIAEGDIEKEDSVLGTFPSPRPPMPPLTLHSEEWTYHLLTFAPPTVLDVTSPTTPTAATFAHARSRAYTTWTPPSISRATFLKEAVSRVYQEKIALRHPPSPTSTSSSTASPTAVTAPSSPLQPQSANDTLASRWRCARHAAEIRAKRNDPSFNLLPPSEDRPMSEFPAVLEKLDSPLSAPPVPQLPSPHHEHSRSPSDIDTSKNFISALVVPAGPQVRDPVDVAVDRLVAMGFDEGKAAKALAETDTGNSIDFAAAMEWLVRERKRDVGRLMHEGYRGPVKREVTPVSPDAVLREPVGLGLGFEEY